MKVVSAFEILIGDFDFKTGDHHADMPVMAPQDAAVAFLCILIFTAIPKAPSACASAQSGTVPFGKSVRIQKPAEIFLILVIVPKAEAAQGFLTASIPHPPTGWFAFRCAAWTVVMGQRLNPFC